MKIDVVVKLRVKKRLDLRFWLSSWDYELTMSGKVSSPTRPAVGDYLMMEVFHDRVEEQFVSIRELRVTRVSHELRNGVLHPRAFCAGKTVRLREVDSVRAKAFLQQRIVPNLTALGFSNPHIF